MAENAASLEASGDTAADLEPLSCVTCRSRKLKCDRSKPACARCVKVGGECAYPESRRKPTFKRKNVKELEARLAQVEGMLKDFNGKELGYDSAEEVDSQGTLFSDFGLNSAGELPNSAPDVTNDSFPRSDADSHGNDHQKDSNLIGLGMSEAPPPFEVVEDLHNTFFATSYHMVPVVHSGRYLQAYYADPLRRPAMCLQYSIWALASHGHPKYDTYCDIFYRRARQYIQADEMKDDGEHFITLQHAQTWVIIATYEAKCMLFTRASMSCSRSVRICQMMGLDRLDGGADDLPPALGPTRTWVELEERRRVFWGAFAIDCHASISTGWPYLINADDIMTRLPASEDAFSSGEQEETSFLHQVFEGASYAGFASTVVVSQIYKSILRHVHRPKPDDYPEDLTHGGFWKRHRELDNQLSSIFMFLPERFQLPAHLRDPSAIHMNLNLHASVICLHHAALEVAEKHNHPQAIIEESKGRLKASAEEIVSIVKMTAHRTSMFKSPMSAISMYCAATVYVYLAKTDPLHDISPVDVSSLQIIVHSMEAIGRTHQITKAFLQQACHDIERNGLGSKIRFPALAKYRDSTLQGFANIPLFARSSVSRHTKIMPVLPGRLPLENPLGVRMEERRGTEAMVKKLIGSDCFQPVIGAVTRSVSGPSRQPTVSDVTDAHTTNKRRRTSGSPAPPDMDMGPGFIPNANASHNPTSAAPWRAQPNSYNNIFPLPDRSTPSSASSPAYNNAGSGGGSVHAVGVSGHSGSNHESPSGNGTAVRSGLGTSTIFGLGNTPEENRIDLRMFQERIVTPVWASEEEIFAAQIAQSMANNGEIPGSMNMSWNFFTGDLQPSWDRQ